MSLQIRASVVAAAALALLAGCESTPVAKAPAAAAPVESRSVADAPKPVTPSANAGGVGQSQVSSVDLTKNSTAAQKPPAVGAAPSERVVFFDFDSYAIKDSYKNMIEGHAKVLAASRAKRMVIEGHADERGGREYNLALGQKRAVAVVKSLELLGATGPQLEAVSFGEERPLEQGHDENAWSRNRRAELKDR
ncbi:Peptidoglycan-associated protein [Rubrivivax sp. A210]|uniref:peptidoglycan-associated lipoprotein Pal n=1 Tax=Rubrivivax sp. A210 TaxID=2772301 RepID=UPI0019199735|nr:peptidoglycan-associated lipoprotein Pal [Rubrivivax sp. A210]CAD5372481.1 Peptidoglycan-associated protein [Rubrivivax sp. A210]